MTKAQIIDWLDRVAFNTTTQQFYLKQEERPTIVEHVLPSDIQYLDIDTFVTQANWLDDSPSRQDMGRRVYIRYDVNGQGLLNWKQGAYIGKFVKTMQMPGHKWVSMITRKE